MVKIYDRVYVLVLFLFRTLDLFFCTLHPRLLLYVFNIWLCSEEVRLEYHKELFGFFPCGQNQCVLPVCSHYAGFTVRRVNRIILAFILNMTVIKEKLPNELLFNIHNIVSLV